MVDMKVSRTVKIGVTGTSKIKNEESVRKKVVQVLEKIDKQLPNTPYDFVVISPLARGADRVLADEIINFKGSNNHSGTLMEVILQEDKKDDSAIFNKLIDISRSTRTLEDILKDDVYKGMAEDYSHAGELVVDESDILIAVWDSDEAEKGDTATIVEYARASLDLPLFIIKPDGSLTSEENMDDFMDDLEFQDIYNTENVTVNDLKKEKENKDKLFKDLNLSEEDQNRVKNNIITQMARANILAMHNQKWHYYSINTVYYFSAAAVFIVAFQFLFLPDSPGILISEAVLMIFILVLYFLNKKKEWHRKWIDYRYLAERLRAATIFSIAGLDCRVSEHLPHQSSGDDWTLKAYQSIYQKQLETPCMGLDFEEKKNFVLKQWITDQKKYYINKSGKHQSRDYKINFTIIILFSITAVCAGFHAIENFVHIIKEIHLLPEILTFLVIFLPVLAASLAGIRVQHEYLRISKRYTQMAKYLNSVEHRIQRSENEKKLVKILDEANKMMLREHQDWRAIFSVRDTELP